MNSVLYRVLTGICLLGLMSACDPEEPGGEGAGGEGGGGQIDGGVGGEGGGQGGMGGGAGGEGGEGGEGGGDPQGPCDQLNEAQCAARDDCAAFTDVFDDFSRCLDASEADCRLLDEGQCAARDTCAWDAEAGTCGAPEVTCADYPEQGPCEAAECHWVDGACQDDPPPMQCDQPDPAACEAAGCQWGEDGCIPRCETFGEAACNVRPECRWNGQACEQAPHMLPCGEVAAPDDCVARDDCTWFEDQCIDAPEGACDSLAEDACLQRPDCEPLYADAPGEMPPEEMPPEGRIAPPGPYVGCQERVFECGAVPLDACERTPGCQIIETAEGQQCAPVDPDGCADLNPLACEQHPRCRYEVEVQCGEEPFPGDEDGDFLPGEPCQEVARCVPDGDAPPACSTLDINACGARVDCQVIEDPDCGGGGALPEPLPGEDPVQPPEPPECLICADVEQPAACWDLDQGACDARNDCQWNGINGGPVPAPDPEDCGCPPDEPDCGCAGLIAPAGFCEPVPADNCFGLDERLCIDRDGCRWVGEGGGALPPQCDCPDDDPDCACVDPILPPPGGFCEPDGGEGCAGLPAERCGANPACEWAPGQEICECFEDGVCECFIAEGFCRERAIPGPCENLAQDECADIPGCAWLDAMVPPCECPPGEDCVCPDGGGQCVFIGEPGCEDLPADQCEAAGCMLEEILPPCAMPCPDGDPECEEVICEPVLICVTPGPQACADLPPERCEAVDGCHVELIDVPCPPPCDADDPNCEPVMCEPVALCVPDFEPGICQADAPDACEAQPGCEWVGGGLCECIVGPDGEEICRCDEGGFCQVAELQPDRCLNLGPADCAEAPECWPLDCDIACQGDPQCMQDCQAAGQQCLPGAEICPQVPLDLCAQIDACEIVVDEVCGGGCDDQGNCEEPVCEEFRRCAVVAP